MDIFSMKSMKVAYLGLITFLLSCIGIKYGISNTNPFHDSTLSLLVTAVCSHLIASAADMDNPNAILIFYLSGIVSCETLLWILIAQLSCCSQEHLQTVLRCQIQKRNLRTSRY